MTDPMMGQRQLIRLALTFDVGPCNLTAVRRMISPTYPEQHAVTVEVVIHA